MTLTEKLIKTPQRENAGGRSTNRYSYQQVWAFNHILELLLSDNDFMLIMEFHDDVFILDNSTNPQSIDFYQIKTDDKDSRYLTTRFITQNSKKYPDKMSILQKMIINYSKFRGETKSIHLVSNKRFDFGVLDNDVHSTDRETIRLYEVNDTVFSKIKDVMCVACDCNECLYDGGCNNNCIYLIHFDVSSLDLVNYEDTVLGKFINFLERKGIESTTTYAKSVFSTLLSEIRRINNDEFIPASFEELIKKKSITKDVFLEIINGLKSPVSENEIWRSIEAFLLSDGLSSIMVNKIGKQWKKYHLDAMNVDSLYLLDIQSDIKILLQANEFTNAGDCIKSIHEIIKTKPYYSIYSKDYISAIIVKELYL